MSKLYKLVFGLLLSATMLFAQTYKISGKVTDAHTGETLNGANVYIPSLNQGAVTNSQGRYSVNKISAGTYLLRVSFIGYKTVEQSIELNANMETNFSLEPTSFVLEGAIVQATKAVERETPVTFTEVGKQEIDSKYNTQDVPGLLEGIPGVFASSGGLGESSIYVRGFDYEQVLILINGVPVNDPESQQVYWSNWTGLSSAASSIQVQKGVGASLIGSGALGGSVNIETGLYSAEPRLKVKGSIGYYTTSGVDGGTNDGKSADGTGGFQSYSPANEAFSVEYTTGQLADGKLNFLMGYERKAGDSWIQGTYYNGHSFYFGVQSILGNHVLEFKAIGAPQRHAQSGAVQDEALIDKLGWEYNRRNHPYQENYYFKPQFELHWDWNISDNQYLEVNSFLTTGTGGGRYLYNDYFDVNTGEVTFKDVSEATSWEELGRNARWIYETTGVELTGYNSADTTFTYGSTTGTVTRSRNVITSQYNHSWRNDSRNDHLQFGMNASYSHKFNDYISVAIGGEARRWHGVHKAESYDFRLYDPATGKTKILNRVQDRYNYDGYVTNLSAFGRLLISPVENLILTVDGQYASSIQEVEEKPIEIYDFVAGKFIGKSYYATKNSGNFTDDDYDETFSFFTPKFGARYNFVNGITVYGSWGQAKKEPKVGDWYNRSSGPLGNDISEEKLTNIEGGIGYQNSYLTVNANYYHAKFEDKIESVQQQDGSYETINAGAATHQGFELAASGVYEKFDANLSISVSSNEWDEMNYQTIFSVPASDVVGKKVPFSPQNMYNVGIGYSFIHGLRLGVSANGWSDYYGNYTNTEKLDDFLEINASLGYDFLFRGTKINMRLDAYNLGNRQQYQEAAYSADYGRNDSLNSQYKMYVLQSRLMSFFFTTSIEI